MIKEALSKKPLYFIADIAANHDGDINRAFNLIELAKEAGADAAKFQNFQAKKIVSNYGFNSLGKALSHQKNWSKSVYEVYDDASIPFDWTEKLKQKCDQVGIDYFTSPYDFESVDHVDPFVKAYKIGSGDITWTDIIHHIAKKNKTTIIASGASELEDVIRCMDILNQYPIDKVLMQCNTNYTASLENFKYVNLKVLNKYREMYPETILGLSDHTPGHATILGAISLGAVVFEKHFTDDNLREGPDHKFAMNPTSWKEMIKYSYELFNSLGNGLKKVEENELEASIVQRRCIRSNRDLKRGDIIKEEYFEMLRPIPNDGIPPYNSELLIGKILKMDLATGEHFTFKHIEI